MTFVALIGVLSCAVTVDAAQLQASVMSTLEGGESSSLECQRILSELMGWRACSPSGIIASGEGVSIEELDPERIRREIPSCVPILYFIGVQGAEDPSTRVYVPVEEGVQYEVFQRLAGGLYVAVDVLPSDMPGYLMFETSASGNFIVRVADEYSNLDPSNLYLTRWLMRGPATTAPEAKANWSLYPVAPDRITGKIPLVLIHDAHAARWDAFVHWAIWSADAEAFRATFQLWTFNHPTYETSAAIGYDAESPQFRESMAAYLNRLIIQAAQRGVDVDGITYRFNGTAYCILAHGQGGLVARALMANFPEHADRILAVVTLATPHMGTPLATPEWVRYAVSRFEFSLPFESVLEGALAEFVLTSQLSTSLQGDMDMGWLNHDALGGSGIPEAEFQSWRPDIGYCTLSLTPRDANFTGARTMPGYTDETFEPGNVSTAYCGGLDLITPSRRGECSMDKFFLYGAYFDMIADASVLLSTASQFFDPAAASDLTETGYLVFLNAIMALMPTQNSNALIGPYAMNDGLVPLQSQLMLDGTETVPIFLTTEAEGRAAVNLPLELRAPTVVEHTLADPTRLRIFPGLNHLQLLFGDYDATTGESEVFSRIAEDLLSVVSAED